MDRTILIWELWDKIFENSHAFFAETVASLSEDAI